MRQEGRQRHPDEAIRWLDDRLPGLTQVHRLGVAYNLILLSAVWMHVNPNDRARAFRKLITLLKPGGVLVITLREGPSDAGRQMWPTPVGEMEAPARDHGLEIIRITDSQDQLGRPDVSWRAVVLRQPDDGTGALPLLRGIILNDDKSSTYKLGLLRAIARVADLYPGVAMMNETTDAVDLPLGLVALNWVRMYLPLVTKGLPQLPKNNKGPEGLGFAGKGFRGLMDMDIRPQDLRVGARFEIDRASAVVDAIQEARNTIAVMPANYITLPGTLTPVFEVEKARRKGLGSQSVTLSVPRLRSYGTIRVPGHVWRAMQRLGVWIEPVLVAEWARIMRGYGDRAGLLIEQGKALDALTWTEPHRETGIARQVLSKLADAGEDIRCVWTGAKLKTSTFDIDHCRPWSAWPCGDLWNLMPASPRVNRDLKRDRLPSTHALASAHDSILAWWEQAWSNDPALEVRFQMEAVAALPVSDEPKQEEIFTGLGMRRFRLRQDKQVKEWDGVS